VGKSAGGSGVGVHLAAAGFAAGVPEAPSAHDVPDAELLPGCAPRASTRGPGYSAPVEGHAHGFGLTSTTCFRTLACCDWPVVPSGRLTTSMEAGGGTGPPFNPGAAARPTSSINVPPVVPNRLQRYGAPAADSLRRGPTACAVAEQMRDRPPACKVPRLRTPSDGKVAAKRATQPLIAPRCFG